MLNKVILMGRLVADPELRQTPSGVAVASFRMAVDRNYTPKDGTKQADFINCVAWRNEAEFISKYFAKGRMIIIEGSIQTRSYTDKDGNKRSAFDVVVDQAYFGDSKSSGGERTASSPSIPFPTPAASVPEPQKGESFSVGDFEDIETDDQLPF